MLLYKVMKNDTLCLIAKKFNTTCKELIVLNDLTNIDFIKEGDILIIKK